MTKLLFIITFILINPKNGIDFLKQTILIESSIIARFFLYSFRQSVKELCFFINQFSTIKHDLN